jgi:hypothetical protein
LAGRFDLHRCLFQICTAKVQILVFLRGFSCGDLGKLFNISMAGSQELVIALGQRMESAVASAFASDCLTDYGRFVFERV